MLVYQNIYCSIIVQFAFFIISYIIFWLILIIRNMLSTDKIASDKK